MVDDWLIVTRVAYEEMDKCLYMNHENNNQLPEFFNCLNEYLDPSPYISKCENDICQEEYEKSEELKIMAKCTVFEAYVREALYKAAEAGAKETCLSYLPSGSQSWQQLLDMGYCGTNRFCYPT